MSTTFTVKFKEHNQNAQKIEFSDSIHLSDAQQDCIHNIASRYTRQELFDMEKAIDVEPNLTNLQMQDVLTFKNKIIGKYTANELFDREIITLTGHSLSRLVDLLGE